MRAWFQRQLLRVALALLFAILAINLSVRGLGGGTPHLLSPLSLKEKSTALVLLLRHHARCVLRGHPDPKPLLFQAAKRHGLPPELILAMARAESNLEPHRISHAGAMGLMQLMPDTANWLGVSDPFDSEANIDASARYLRLLHARYRGDRRRMAAAYNAGPGRVPRRGALSGLPGETRLYVERVTQTSAPSR